MACQLQQGKGRGEGRVGRETSLMLLTRSCCRHVGELDVLRGDQPLLGLPPCCHRRVKTGMPWRPAAKLSLSTLSATPEEFFRGCLAQPPWRGVPVVPAEEMLPGTAVVSLAFLSSWKKQTASKRNGSQRVLEANDPFHHLSLASSGHLLEITSTPCASGGRGLQPRSLTASSRRRFELLLGVPLSIPR